ncbi:MAG: acyl-CoA carboxylase subunit beta [Blautia sp.]|jgi:acetyl-CoA carboxylase carboxyltransferase component
MEYPDLDTYQLDKQHKKGKLHAIERILSLVDHGSFREIGSGIRNQSEAFGLKKGCAAYDGVITGYGRIDGRPVVIYAQDFTVLAGTLGYKHGEKIAHAICLAIENRCPLIGINDSGGARIQEGVDALAGYGDIFYYNTLASGYIPQISIIAGNCAGGAAYSPGITDFVFMVENISNMYITGPKVVETVLHQKVSVREFGSAGMHQEKSGVIHFSEKNEEDCYRQVKKLLSLIPHYYGENPTGQMGFHENTDRHRTVSELLPKRRTAVYDMRKVIEALADEASFLEVEKGFASNILVGFGRLKGKSVGFVANQPFCMGGVLDVDSSVKAARFVRYCDCFDIPIVTLVDVPGFMPGVQQEERGIIRHGAKLLYAYAESTVSKVTVILRRAYGGAYIAMGSKHIGIDFVYAWPGAEIAVMGEEPAVEILFHKELDGLDKEERQQRFGQLSSQYCNDVMNADRAVEQGYVDEILSPEDTRERIWSDLNFLQNKRKVCHVEKKHGNIPL